MSQRALGEQFTASLSYRFTPGAQPGESGTTSARQHRVEAHDSQSQVGYLDWDARTDGAAGTVGNVYVHRDVRRRGVASALWAKAHEQGVNPPKHSPAQTALGQAWAGVLANRQRGAAPKPRRSKKPAPDQESLF